MNVRHPMGVLHSLSIKNVFYDKMDIRLFNFLKIRKLRNSDIISKKMLEISFKFEMDGIKSEICHAYDFF